MDELLSAINKYPNGTILMSEWDSGLKIKGEIDTIYETDNGLEEGEDGFKEFYACVLNILDLISFPIDGTQAKAGSLIEISMQDPPAKICLLDGIVIWEKKSKI